MESFHFLIKSMIILLSLLSKTRKKKRSSNCFGWEKKILHFGGHVYTDNCIS